MNPSRYGHLSRKRYPSQRVLVREQVVDLAKPDPLKLRPGLEEQKAKLDAAAAKRARKNAKRLRNSTDADWANPCVSHSEPA